MHKIQVVGSSCSGKTTLARRLSQLLAIEHMELDAQYWLSNWTARDRLEFHSVVSDTVEKNQWIVDGNYRSKLGNLVSDRADTIIWLDLPFITVYRRVIIRCAKRIFSRAQLWNGNTENLRNLLFRRDSLLYWVPGHWQSLKDDYGALFTENTNSRNLLRFKSASELENWLADLRRTTDTGARNTAG